MKQIFSICLTALILTTIPFTIQVQIVHKSSGLCVDAKGGKIQDGTDVILWRCHGGANQDWKQSFSDGGKRTFTVESEGSSRVMDVKGGSRDNGAKVIIWGSHGGDNQKWYWDGTNGSLRNVRSGKCLDVSGNKGFEGLQWIWCAKIPIPINLMFIKINSLLERVFVIKFHFSMF